MTVESVSGMSSWEMEAMTSPRTFLAGVIAEKDSFDMPDNSSGLSRSKMTTVTSPRTLPGDVIDENNTNDIPDNTP